MFRFMLAAAAALLLTGAADAETITYLCRQPDVSEAAWLKSEMMAVHDTAAGTALAVDPVTQYFAGGPVEAKITRNDDKVVTFQWSVRTRGTNNRTGTIRYTLHIDKATLKSQSSATALGYRNRENQRGTCEILKGRPGKRKK
ncbi:MAG: hypothetical protein LBE86_03715 [Gemmobacter sp.]|jgi:hypothetical protein|nr:hypothetical protein [Gemmobacter sp.]